MSLDDTVKNKKWLKENALAISKVFPETFTHVRNLNMLQIGYALKVGGINWTTEDELAECLVIFEKNKIIARDNVLVKRCIL